MAASVVVMIGVLGVKPARAASITVNTTSDVLNSTDGKCSLREAVRAANSNSPSGSVAGECTAGVSGGTDVITLIPATYSLTHSSGSLDFLANSAWYDVKLQVSGGAATISQNASPDDRVMYIHEDTGVLVYNITFQGGSNVASGGGILNEGVLELNNSIVTANHANKNGGGIDNRGFLELNNSTVSNNTSDIYGGGIRNGNNASIIANSVEILALAQRS